MQTYQSHKRVQAAQIKSVTDESPARETVDVYLTDGSTMMVGRAVFARYKPVAGDYLVQYEDGYLSVSPKAAFEEGYTELVNGGTDEALTGGASPGVAPIGSFSWALMRLIDGVKVARRGWNGKGMWIAISSGNPELEAHCFWNPHAKQNAVDNGGYAPVLDTVIMRTADGSILMGWLASQSDMLANDWEEIE